MDDAEATPTCFKRCLCVLSGTDSSFLGTDSALLGTDFVLLGIVSVLLGTDLLLLGTGYCRSSENDEQTATENA